MTRGRLVEDIKILVATDASGSVQKLMTFDVSQAAIAEERFVDQVRKSLNVPAEELERTVATALLDRKFMIPGGGCIQLFDVSHPTLRQFSVPLTAIVNVLAESQDEAVGFVSSQLANNAIGMDVLQKTLKLG